MQKNLLSIITVVKNDEQNIQKTIKSIISQKKINYEYIIIDGKSTDNTLNKILKYKNKINKIISKKDKGIYDAMNKGLKIANGEVIVFCNSGDFFYKNSGKLNKKSGIKTQVKNSKNVGRNLAKFHKTQQIYTKALPILPEKQGNFTKKSDFLCKI